MKKALKISIFLAILILGGIKFASAQSTYTPGNLHGWVWSSNIGWISLNCAEGGATGGSVCASGSTGSNYSVSVNPTTGVFSGYAWSSNIGWLSFEPGDVTSQCGTPVATLATSGSSANTVSGWARFLTGSTTSGWDGCVKFSGTGYGVTYSASATPNLTGYSWGSDVVGWMMWRGTLSLGAPAVDLKINDSGVISDGPLTMPSSGGTAQLTWTTNNVTSCTGTGLGASATPTQTDWSSFTLTPTTGATVTINVAPNTGTSTVSHVYMLKCTNGTTVVTDAVTVNVTSATAPYLELLANGSTGPITVDSGSIVRLTYTTANIQPNTCLKTASVSYPSWTTNTPATTPTNVIPSIYTSNTGTPITASFNTLPITGTTVFTIGSCSPVGGGTALSRSVTINVAPATCEVAPTPYVFAAPSGATTMDVTQYFGVIWHHTSSIPNTLISVTPGSSGGYTPTFVAGTDSSASTTLTATHTNVGIKVTGASPSASVGPFTVNASTTSGPSITCTPGTFTIGPAGSGAGTGSSSSQHPPWIEF